MVKDDVQTYHATSRAAWREWLTENHATKQNVWLIIYHKKSATPSVYYDEAVDEALCFGWIDSVAKKRDEESRYQFFSKRKPKSNWSRINKAKVERLVTENLMTPAGSVMIDLAKQTGTFDEIIAEILNIGFDVDDLQHLERLSDRRILARLPEELQGAQLRHNVREDVSLYLTLWADMVADSIEEQDERMKKLAHQPTPSVVENDQWVEVKILAK